MIEAQQQPEPPRIWTIGHGSLDFDTLATALNRHRIQTIVDVRTQPYSKHAPEFTKSALQESASAAGFGYRWMGRKLGGMPPPQQDELMSGIDELIGLTVTSRVVLLCSEIDPVHCHRDGVLAPALSDRGYDVTHILGDGSAMPHQDHLGI